MRLLIAFLSCSEMQALTLPACISFSALCINPNVAEFRRHNGAQAPWLPEIRPLSPRRGRRSICSLPARTSYLRSQFLSVLDSFSLPDKNGEEELDHSLEPFGFSPPHTVSETRTSLSSASKVQCFSRMAPSRARTRCARTLTFATLIPLVRSEKRQRTNSLGGSSPLG